jgi:hypothetical protein
MARKKTYEVPIIMRIQAKNEAAAKEEVVKWMQEMTGSTDNFPPNFNGATISTPKKE